MIATTVNPTDAAWWLPQNKERRADLIQAVARDLWQAAEPHRANMIRAARLYGNAALMGFGPSQYRTRAPGSRGSRLAYNVVKSVCDTYVSLITKDKPKISFVTSDADWDMQQRAEKLEEFCDGVFYESDLYEKAANCVLDSAEFGTSAVKIFEDDYNEGDPRIGVDRLFPWSVLVNDEESMYGKPPAWYTVTHVDLRRLQAEYPDHAGKIQTAGGSLMEEQVSDATGNARADLRLVVEAWHPPTSKRDTDGLHCITVGSLVLFEEQWTDEDAPIELLTRLPPQMGVWGTSLADELSGIQYEINVLLQKIQQTHQRNANGRWLCERGSEVNTGQFGNGNGEFTWYRGTPPQYFPGGDVNPGLYSHLDSLYAKAFELIGTSAMSAQSIKPAGIVSGRAIDAYADVQTARFQPCYRTYQHWFLRIARQSIRLARRISKRHPTYGVKSAGREVMKVIKWAESDLDDADFVLKLYPTNAFSDDPVARMDQVQGLAGMDPATKRLLDFPDLKRAQTLADASYDRTNRMAADILKRGTYAGPEPYMNLAESVPLMQMLLLDAENKGCPEANLRMARKWIVNAESQLQAKPAPPTLIDPNALPPGAPLPGGPPMPPGPPNPQQVAA